MTTHAVTITTKIPTDRDRNTSHLDPNDSVVRIGDPISNR
jgi:hypothetical protein